LSTLKHQCYQLCHSIPVIKGICQKNEYALLFIDKKKKNEESVQLPSRLCSECSTNEIIEPRQISSVSNLSQCTETSQLKDVTVPAEFDISRFNSFPNDESRKSESDVLSSGVGFCGSTIKKEYDEEERKSIDGSIRYNEHSGRDTITTKKNSTKTNTTTYGAQQKNKCAGQGSKDCGRKGPKCQTREEWKKKFKVWKKKNKLQKQFINKWEGKLHAIQQQLFQEAALKFPASISTTTTILQRLVADKSKKEKEYQDHGEIATYNVLSKHTIEEPQISKQSRKKKKKKKNKAKKKEQKKKRKKPNKTKVMSTGEQKQKKNKEKKH